MADESPEQIRERVFQEELDKGSEPRVAEGRAKAAELRAKQGFPIDPQEAAKAKLEREGAPPGVTGEEAPAPEEAEEPPAAEEAPEEPSEAAEAEEAPAEEALEPDEEEAPAEAPAPERPAAAVPPGVALTDEVEEKAPAPPAARAEPAEPFEPEIGEPIEMEDEELVEMAGISLRESSIPTWVMVVLLSLMAWAVLYLVVFGGSDSSGAAGCRLEADRTFACFMEEESPEEAPETP